MLDKTQDPVQDQEFKVVGSRPLRPDGVDKVTGRARFGADISAPGMLVGKVLRSPHAHARIHSIDVARRSGAGRKGDRHPGRFRRMRQAARRPAQRHGPRKGALRRPCRRRGGRHQRRCARKALKLIEVDYDILPHVIDVEADGADAPDPA